MPLFMIDFVYYYTIGQGDTCAKPVISNGQVTPAAATVNVGAPYTITCNTGFTLSDPEAGTLTCQDGGTFNKQTPTCSKLIHQLTTFLATWCENTFV